MDRRKFLSFSAITALVVPAGWRAILRGEIKVRTPHHGIQQLGSPAAKYDPTVWGDFQADATHHGDHAFRSS